MPSSGLLKKIMPHYWVQYLYGEVTGCDWTASFLLLSSPFLPFRPKYLPQHSLLSNALSSCLSLMWDQVTHPYKTTDKIIFLYIVILWFVDSKWEDNCFVYTKPESKQWK